MKKFEEKIGKYTFTRCEYNIFETVFNSIQRWWRNKRAIKVDINSGDSAETVQRKVREAIDKK